MNRARPPRSLVAAIAGAAGRCCALPTLGSVAAGLRTIAVRGVLAAALATAASLCMPWPTAAAAQAAGPVQNAPAVATDPVAEQRLKHLSEELRCLVCQNQTLADSHAELAVDLRNQVFAMIAKGQSDDEIRRYLVERYGDFVLYRPPVQGNTMLLWFGPFVLLLVGAGAWLLIQRRSREAAATHAPSPSPEEQERARKLLEG